MKMPPFPHDLEKYSDYDLGALLLGYFIAAQAVKLRINPDDLPKEFLEQIIKNILSEDTTDYKMIPLEKALQKAADGDFEKAGEIFRGYFKSSAAIKAALDEATTGRRRQKRAAQAKRTSTLKNFMDITGTNLITAVSIEQSVKFA